MAFNPALLVKLEPSSLFTQPATIPNVQPTKAAPQFWMYQATGDSRATVEASGYFVYFADWLNTLEYNNGQFFQVGDLVYCVCSDGNVELTISTLNPITTSTSGSGFLSTALASGHIFVGNASGVATDTAVSGILAITNAGVTSIPLTSANILVGSGTNVAAAVALSGDATLANTGALTIANNAITTAKILNANVTLAKLAAGITPSHIIVFGAQYTTVGGAAAEAITVTGAVGATDRAFVQLVAPGSNTVSVSYAVVTNNTLTVTFSGNPGNNAIINYQIIRAAA